MATHGYKTGARTRNVINIANVGSTSTKAYSVDKDNLTDMAEPTTAVHGYRNEYGQKWLHVLVHNDNVTDASSGAMGIAADKITIWVYKSALGGTTSWAPLRVPVHDNSSGALKFPTAVIPDAIAHDGKYHMVVPIDGAERVAVVLGSTPYTGGTGTFDGVGSLDVYLGVNTI